MQGRSSQFQINTNKILEAIESQGYGIVEFAREVDVPYGSLHRYFKQGYMPHRVRRKVAEKLGCDIADFILVPTPFTEKQEQTAQAENSDEGPDSGGPSLKRRDFIQLGIATTITAATTTTEHINNPDLWERLSKALKKPNRVDSTVISNLEQIKDHCYHLIPDVYGLASEEMTSYVRRHLDTTTTLLEGASTKYQKPLSSIAAEFSIVIALMNNALNETNNAQMAYNMALECAIFSNHAELQVIIPTRIALLFIHQGLSSVALDYLRQARKAAENANITPTTRSWINAVYAEAQANMNNEKISLKSLEAAGLAQGHRKPGEDPYWTKFDKELYAGYQGVCYLRLNRLDNAKAALSQSLKKGASLYRRATVLSDLADVCIKQSHIDEACTHTEQVIYIAQMTALPGVVKQAKQLHQQLVPYRTITAVTQIEEQMYSYGILH